MGALGMVMVLMVLLLVAGALVASLQVLDRVAGPPRETLRAPRRAVLADDRHYPSYGWDLVERAISCVRRPRDRSRPWRSARCSRTRAGRVFTTADPAFRPPAPEQCRGSDPVVRFV